MILKKLAHYGLTAAFLFGNALSMEGNAEKQLVIGCRPWDKNVEGFSDVKTADFVDFMVEYTEAPSPLPSNFYHLDTDNRGLNSSGSFSDFAANPNHVGKYQTIIIDWATYQHIRREEAWVDFASLLRTNGTLVVPVTHVTYPSFKERVVVSKKTAEELITQKKLTDLFGDVKVVEYNDTRQDTRFELLRRPNLEPGRLEDFLEMEPAIIVAKKECEPQLTSLEEVQFPSLDEMLGKLKNNNSLSTVHTETDVFDVQVLSAHGNRFWGFQPEVDLSRIGLQMKTIAVMPVRDLRSQKHNGNYNLWGLFNITFEGSESKMGIPLHLKVDRQPTGYIVEGEGVREKVIHESGVTSYQISDLNHVKIFRKR